LMNMPLSDFFNLIHHEDLPPVQQCLAFIKNLKPFDPTTQRFSIYFRLRDGKGEYRHIKNEHLAIKTESNTYLYLMLFNNISEEEKFYHVKLEARIKTKSSYLKTYTYNPKQQAKSITPRQNDIARLIIKGLTNQEIADHLNVSIYTVKNHKQMLFRKINVKSSAELAHVISQRRIA
jgi:DNA-binding CsgD family transcriptional regulator